MWRHCIKMDMSKEYEWGGKVRALKEPRSTESSEKQQSSEVRCGVDPHCAMITFINAREPEWEASTAPSRLSLQLERGRGCSSTGIRSIIIWPGESSRFATNLRALLVNKNSNNNKNSYLTSTSDDRATASGTHQNPKLLSVLEQRIYYWRKLIEKYWSTVPYLCIMKHCCRSKWQSIVLVFRKKNVENIFYISRYVSRSSARKSE